MKHALEVHTAHASYPGPDRLDVSIEAGPFGRVFAPSEDTEREARWNVYSRLYTAEMRRSYREHRAEWDLLLASKRVVLVCSCPDPLRCHRSILAEILRKCGAHDYGEIREWDLTGEALPDTTPF